MTAVPPGGRTTFAPGPLLVRIGIFAAALAAVFLAFPRPFLWCPIALLPALVPRANVPTVFMVGTGVAWLAQTSGRAAHVPIWRLAAVALALYFVHAGAALIGLVPRDTILPPGLFRPWLIRIGLVGAATIALAAFAAVLAGPSRPDAGIIATAIGLPIAVAVAAYLAFLVKRR